ncbi:MAG TPA: histidinol dehydrogenase [Candidatus Acidoferrales bacterium]|nr:histidinol dehydrogenase [Candidatus Acidoferrales bacterium]
MKILRLTKVIQEKLLAAHRPDQAAERVAARIVNDVRRRGDAALFAWTKRLDGYGVDRNSVWIRQAEFDAAVRGVSREFLEAMKRAARNIRAVARKQKPQEWRLETTLGVRVSQRVSPIETIGCYIPGGRFSLVSTLLMTVIPAQEAGVRRIVVASPQPGRELLAAAAFLGVRRIARIGGAQAIAALAYGTRSIPRVDKIFGPGNRYVTAAKRLIGADCAIDLSAGPTEAVVLATRGNARLIAADLLAQAEHDPDAVALCVTPSETLARAVAAEVDEQLRQLPKNNPAWRSMARNGAVLVARDLAEAVEFVNRLAPEHLSLPEGGHALLRRFHSAGSIFLGEGTAQAIGDYASGTNHVLPTGGAARARGGLSTADFVKCITVQEVTRAGLTRLAPVVREFADAEGLIAHRRAVEARLGGIP